MKLKRGAVLILAGLAGCIFVSVFDILVGKPVNDITGPKSISALLVCGFLIILGIRLLLKKE
ncbi:hypothetical protein ACFL1D_05980 [Candidatus Omnitrophota bacterium]